MLGDFLKNEAGATMIEYGLIGALVSVAAVVVLLLVGGGVESVFDTSSGALESGAQAALGN